MNSGRWACLAATLTLKAVAGPNFRSSVSIDRSHEARDGVDQSELDGQLDERRGRMNLALAPASS
jgi:hypothetical protein